MATVVGVTDEAPLDSNTDILVVVDPEERRLLWIPRDLWCPGLRKRINQAYMLHGHGGVLRALAEHDIAARHGLYVSRKAASRALEGVSVEVAVSERLEFWYPLSPERPIEQGRKRIRFEPPFEDLSGERIHQWIGARYGADRPRSDLDRIERQKVLLAALLRDGYDFRAVLESSLPVRSSGPEALRELSLVRPTWRFDTLEGLSAAMIEGKIVLTRAQ
jgi:hypothetical protein